MDRSLMLALVALLAMSTASLAQSAAGRSVESNPRAGALNERNITSTGETVPNPGASQSGGTTSLDIGAQRRDNEIQNSICRGC